MTDRTITQADKDAYNARRRSLAERGIANIPDLYDADELTDETDPTGALRHWRRINREADEARAAEARDGAALARWD